jgi:hypothetical protein
MQPSIYNLNLVQLSSCESDRLGERRGERVPKSHHNERYPFVIRYSEHQHFGFWMTGDQ